MTAPPPADAQPRCSSCADVVGVYEPAVAVIRGEAVATSWLRLREPAAVEAIYHRGCHPLGAPPTRRPPMLHPCRTTS